MTLTQAEEERLLKTFDRACYKAAHDSNIDGYEFGDLVQEAKLAALQSIRRFDPFISSCRLSGYVIEGIKLRLSALYRSTAPRSVPEKRKQGRWNGVRFAECLSLDARLAEDGNESFLDLIPSSDRADTSLMQMACEKFCSSEIEVDILAAVAGGHTYTSVGKKHGLSRERIRQIKEVLFERLREEISL